MSHYLSFLWAGGQIGFAGNSETIIRSLIGDSNKYERY